MTKFIGWQTFVVRDPVHGYLSRRGAERLRCGYPDHTKTTTALDKQAWRKWFFPKPRLRDLSQSRGHASSIAIYCGPLENGSRTDVQVVSMKLSAINWKTLRMEDLDCLLEHSGAFECTFLPFDLKFC